MTSCDEGGNPPIWCWTSRTGPVRLSAASLSSPAPWAPGIRGGKGCAAATRGSGAGNDVKSSWANASGALRPATSAAASVSLQGICTRRSCWGAREREGEAAAMTGSRDLPWPQLQLNHSSFQQWVCSPWPPPGLRDRQMKLNKKKRKGEWEGKSNYLSLFLCGSNVLFLSLSPCFTCSFHNVHWHA